MSLRTKQFVIGLMGFLFLASLIFVQWMEVVRKEQEAGLLAPHVAVPANSSRCYDCHKQSGNTPGIVEQWHSSTHALKGIGCLECHKANEKDADSYEHYGEIIATIVTPRDCSRCHEKEYNQFEHSHHAKAGNILASLDNVLAEKVEGNRVPFNPH